MKFATRSVILSLATLLIVILCGCVSKSEARKQRNAAYIAGKNSGMVQALQSQAASVTVVGDVKNRVLIWSPDLTVAKAFLQADYQGITDPHAFVVRHGNEQLRISPQQLLNGQDFELLPGDILEIQQ